MSEAKNRYIKCSFSDKEDIRKCHEKYYSLYPQFFNKSGLKKYKLTIDQFNQMKISQNNKCAICENEFINRRKTHIDHNHTTNQIRQLLCPGCNFLLGHAKENIILLQKAINYLIKWNCK